MPAGSAFAATIHVGGAGSADCSLAEAVGNANDAAQTNSDCTGGDSGGNTIILFSTQTLAANLPNITRDLTINGGGNTISGANTHQCFVITAAGVDLSLNGVIIDGCRRAGAGGAIYYAKDARTPNQPRSSLALNDVVLRNSQATDSNHGGGIYVWSTSVDYPIYVTINRSAIHGNTAGNNGGGLYITSGSQFTMNNSTVYGNTAAGRGGGMYLDGPDKSQSTTHRLNHVTITGNTANTTGANKGRGIRAFGGTLWIRNSIIAGNGGEDCRIGSADDITVQEVSNSIIGASSTANCPTIQVNGAAVTDPGLAASATVSGLRAYYDLMSNSPAINAAGDCRSITRHDQRYYYRPYPAHQSCDIGAIERGPQRGRTEPGRSGGGSGGDGDGGGEYQPAPTPVSTPTPRPPTCLSLPDHISVYNITHSTQCTRMDAAGIGNAAVLGLGFRDGVDVWGWVLPNTQVCFDGSSGSFRFLDAATSPRAVSELPAFGKDGRQVCATINRAGTVAWVNGPPVPAPTAIPPAYQSLSGCMVLLQYSLNFRDAPDGDKIGALPSQVKLTALERTDGWFHVDYHGARGWISAAYVKPEGDCG